MARQDFRFAHRLRVRWAEVDMQKIVFNGHYLLYFDVAVMEYWRALGVNYPDGLIARFGCDSVAVKSVVEYHASARFDQELDVCVRCARLGNSSSLYLLEIHRGDEHLISGELHYVNVDASTHKSIRLPDPLRELMRAYEGDKLADSALAK
jgi:acyl-CoA thioester hydrolase